MNKYSIAAAIFTVRGLASEFLSMMASDKGMQQEIQEEVSRQIEETMNKTWSTREAKPRNKK